MSLRRSMFQTSDRNLETTIGCRENSAVLFEPQERADAANSLKFHLQTAAGHNTSLSLPAGLMVEIDTVHVKVFANLLDLALLQNLVFQKDLRRECHAILVP